MNTQELFEYIAERLPVRRYLSVAHEMRCLAGSRATIEWQVAVSITKSGPMRCERFSSIESAREWFDGEVLPLFSPAPTSFADIPVFVPETALDEVASEQHNAVNQ